MFTFLDNPEVLDPEAKPLPAVRCIVAIYDYTDEDGKLLFQKVRYDPKDFDQRRPDPTGKDGWIWNKKGVRSVLYHLHELVSEVFAEREIYIAEEEKDVAVLRAHGFAATCNPEGASKSEDKPKWRDSYSESLRGAPCIVIADKDRSGRTHAGAVARLLQGFANSVKILELPDVNGKPVKDAADFFAAGGEPMDLQELAHAAPFWTPKTQVETVSSSTPEPQLAESASCRPEAPRRSALPDWVDAAVFCSEPHDPPPEIIRGVLHQGCKLVLGGSSKAHKTWGLLDLALSVATGSNWLRFQTTKGKVLFVNFELKPFSIHARLRAISEAKGVTIPGDGQLCLWNLRGYSGPYEVLLPQLAERIEGFGLVILDPSYKLLGQADENSARDVAALLNGIERLSETTGAASAFSAHFAKGLASSKEAIDRISGSGVYARDPDAIITLTALQTPDAYCVETVLRAFAPQKPFAVRWEYPLMRVADAMDPGDLKQPASRTTKPRPTSEQVLALFRDCPGTPRTGLLTAAQLRNLFDTHGWDRTAAPAARDQLEAEGKLKVHIGSHNTKLTGLPNVVDSFEKQQAETDTILEQTALPKRQRKGPK